MERKIPRALEGRRRSAHHVKPFAAIYPRFGIQLSRPIDWRIGFGPSITAAADGSVRAPARRRIAKMQPFGPRQVLALRLGTALPILSVKLIESPTAGHFVLAGK
jgi:hypothetical protein